jgi:type IV secretory pathway VirB4 component
MSEPIFIAQGEGPIYLLPRMANRHGLIAGATGTGKTVTLQTLAENLARGEFLFSWLTSKVTWRE